MGLEQSLPGLDHAALAEEVKETTSLVILALGSMMHIGDEQVGNKIQRALFYSNCVILRTLFFVLFSSN